MKCAFCENRVNTVEEAIKAGWIPGCWNVSKDEEIDGPLCPKCIEQYTVHNDKFEDYELKEEFEDLEPNGNFTEEQKMKIICNCGTEMILSIYEPDQDESYEGYDCPSCGASFYGTYKKGEIEDEC